MFFFTATLKRATVRDFSPVSREPSMLRPENGDLDSCIFAAAIADQKIKACAIAAKMTGTTGEGIALKLGETPPFGPHTPARVITLIGGDRELFLQGRRAENRAMGIGAFAYYRRVVENQKTRIIEQIGKVAAKLGAKPEILKEFEAAAKETQFSTAIEKIKHGIPDVLLVDGHNPVDSLAQRIERRSARKYRRRMPRNSAIDQGRSDGAGRKDLAGAQERGRTNNGCFATSESQE
jgi:hypothetical protein